MASAAVKGLIKALKAVGGILCEIPEGMRLEGKKLVAMTKNPKQVELIMVHNSISLTEQQLNFIVKFLQLLAYYKNYENNILQKFGTTRHVICMSQVHTLFLHS